MSRPLTCFCMLLAGLAGLYLYQVKHHARLLDRQIAHVMAEAEATRAQTRLASAEWTLLNQPERLQDLAERYLHLLPMAPSQFVPLADLGAHMPPLIAGRPSEHLIAESSTDEDDFDSTPPVSGESRLPPTGVRIRRAPVRHLGTEAAAPIVSAALLTVRHEMRHKPLVQDRIVTESKQIVPKPVLLVKPLPLPLAAPRRAPRVLLTTMTVPRAVPAPRLSGMRMAAFAPERAMQQMPPVFRPPLFASALGMSAEALPPPVPVSAMR